MKFATETPTIIKKFPLYYLDTITRLAFFFWGFSHYWPNFSCLADWHLAWRGRARNFFKSAYLEVENSEFFQVPGPACREKTIYDDSHLASLYSRPQSLCRGESLEFVQVSGPPFLRSTLSKDEVLINVNLMVSF